MPFIGNQPAEKYSAFTKQDFSTSATTSYTLSQSVANENEIALFINFVRQEPTTAYTASGTSLTLTSATSGSDDMYCVYLGKAVQTVNPPSGSVGSSQVAASIITGQTALGATPADTDELLISDAGTLKRVDYSYLKVDNTPAFSVGKSGDQSIDNAETMTKITWDTEHLDTDNAFASNKFTVPSGEGGTYFISFNFRVQSNTNSTTSIAVGKIYKNGSILHNTDSRVDFRANPGRGAGITSTVLVTLSAGDYIEFYGGNNATGGTSEIQYRGTLAQGFKILT